MKPADNPEQTMTGDKNAVAPDTFPQAVSKQRWQAAQQWELKFWNRQNIPSALWKRMLRPFLVFFGLRDAQVQAELDDRNQWWQKVFNNYQLIPKSLGNVCELGCGPYTNIRLIREDRSINNIYCSDPLARHYIQYQDAWLANAFREGLVNVDFQPAEQCHYKSEYFDLVIMINVLDHVQDAEKCLQEALRVLSVGGHFVFAQDLTSAEDVQPSM